MEIAPPISPNKRAATADFDSVSCLNGNGNSWLPACLSLYLSQRYVLNGTTSSGPASLIHHACCCLSTHNKVFTWTTTSTTTEKCTFTSSSLITVVAIYICMRVGEPGEAGKKKSKQLLSSQPVSKVLFSGLYLLLSPCSLIIFLSTASPKNLAVSASAEQAGKYMLVVLLLLLQVA